MAAPGHSNRAAKLADTFNRAVQLQVAGRFAEAAGLYDGLLRQAPNHPDILDLYGTLWHQVGDNLRAADLVGRSIARRPLAGATQNRYGSILRLLGRRLPAASAFRRAALVDPGLVEPMTNMALVLAEAGDHVRCLAWCARALAVSPGSVDALLRRASVLNAQRRFDAASIDLAAAGRRYPTYPEIWLQRMIARSGLGDPGGALRSARTGMIIAPAAFEFYAGLVSSRDPTMDTDTATDGFVRWARRAVTLNPREGVLWGNLGLELYRAASPEAAFQAARRGVLLSPGAASTIQALISSGLQSERLPLTRTACRRGLMAHPGTAEFAAVLADVEFVIGDLALAWELYRSRVERRVFVPRIGSPPAWEGPGSESGPLLVASEQGVGDEVIFLSCLPDLLAALRVPVVVEVDARIVPVIARSFPAVTVIPRQLIHSAETGEAFDHTAVTEAYGLRHCVLAGDLPRYFRRDRARPSPRGGYLTPAAERVDHWRCELARFRPNRLVGVV